MSPEQAAQILASLNEIEAWAGGLLQKCAQTRKLIEGSTAAPAGKPSGLSPEQRAEISAKARARWIKPKKSKE